MDVVGRQAPGVKPLVLRGVDTPVRHSDYSPSHFPGRQEYALQGFLAENLQQKADSKDSYTRVGHRPTLSMKGCPRSRDHFPFLKTFFMFRLSLGDTFYLTRFRRRFRAILFYSFVHRSRDSRVPSIHLNDTGLTIGDGRGRQRWPHDLVRCGRPNYCEVSRPLAAGTIGWQGWPVPERESLKAPRDRASRRPGRGGGSS